MKLELKNDGYKCSLETNLELSYDKLCKVLSKMEALIGEITDSVKSVPTESNIQKVTNVLPTLQVIPERPAFRDRLPNNVVDVSELTIKQAVQEKALIRCPHCGQAHAVIVQTSGKSYLMRRDFDKNEFVAVSSWDTNDTDALHGVCRKEEVSKLAYYNSMQTIEEDKSIGDFVCDNTTELFCPVCHQSDVFADWKNAFHKPLQYFETEELCDACGGETLDKITKGKHFTKCEECGLEKTVPIK